MSNLHERHSPLLESHVQTPQLSDSIKLEMTNTSSKSWIHSILSQREMLYWCSYWFFMNLTITFYNKHVLSSLNISPLINTFVHMTFTFIGCFMVQRGVFPSLTQNEFIRMVFYAFVFALNIVWCQFAIKLTTLSLNQVCRAMTPLFQATFSYLLANKKHSIYSLLPLVPVCFGASLTANSELDLQFAALIVSVSSVVVSALKGVLSMKIMQQDLKTKLQEYSFLIIVCPLAAAWVVILNLFFYFLYSRDNEHEHENASIHLRQFTPRIIFLLAIGGVMAFAVNVASIGTVKRTSATSMGVMANSKQAVTIFGSLLFIESSWMMQKLFGVCVALCGAGWYSYRKEMERRQNFALPK